MYEIKGTAVQIMYEITMPDQADEALPNDHEAPAPARETGNIIKTWFNIIIQFVITPIKSWCNEAMYLHTIIITHISMDLFTEKHWNFEFKCLYNSMIPRW